MCRQRLVVQLQRGLEPFDPLRQWSVGKRHHPPCLGVLVFLQFGKFVRADRLGNDRSRLFQTLFFRIELRGAKHVEERRHRTLGCIPDDGRNFCIVSVPNSSSGVGAHGAAGARPFRRLPLHPIWRSGRRRCGRCQCRGLPRGGVVREALDDFDEVVFGIEVVGAAVGQKGVDEGVVRAGFEAAEEHPVFHAELGGPDHVRNEVGVDFQNSLTEAVADFFPLVEGVAEGLADVAERTLGFILLEDEVVEFVGDGQAPGAADQLAACGRRRDLAGVLY